MKILFVKPDKSISESKKQKTFIEKFFSKLYDNNLPKTLAFPILAALTPKNYEIEVVEGGLKNIDFDGNYDLVAITGVTINALLAYQIADEFKRRGKTVVLGGWHASALPEEAKQHADAVVVGEAEELWPILLKDFESKSIKPFYYQNRPVDVKNIPNLRIDIYPKNSIIPLQATRGCPHGCEFCAITHMGFRRVFRKRNIEDVLSDIKSINRKSFIFYDNSFTIDTKYTKELFKRMIGLNKSFSAYGNVNILNKDEELLKISAEAGCRSWFIGFDSLCQESIDSTGKSSNKVQHYLEAANKIHDHGIMVQGGIIFGFDNDTLDVFRITEEFVRLSEIDHLSVNILTPFPGTPLFNRLKSENRILTYDWSRYDTGGDVVFRPKNMTSEELYENTKDFHHRFYSKSENMKRLLRSAKYGFDAFKTTMFINMFEKNQSF